LLKTDTMSVLIVLYNKSRQAQERPLFGLDS